eukprot:507389-Rhodomonas_salina.1
MSLVGAGCCARFWRFRLESFSNCAASSEVVDSSPATRSDPGSVSSSARSAQRLGAKGAPEVLSSDVLACRSVELMSTGVRGVSAIAPSHPPRQPRQRQRPQRAQIDTQRTPPNSIAPKSKEQGDGSAGETLVLAKQKPNHNAFSNSGRADSG